ncbi:MAG: hypothetical protein JWM28_464 [Chitinophagaceae bacterium]|nr:hypothetical protein [Chitinophagaceae bacterium]
MKHSNKVLVFCIAILCFCCNSKNDKQKKLSKIEISKDTLPKNAITPDNLGKNDLSVVTRLLGLKDIKNKSSITQIRIWFGYALSDSGKVVVLNNENNVWSSSAYFFKYLLDENHNLISIEKKVDHRNPISGWPAFLRKLTELNMYKLKNYDKIPKYYVCGDGDALSIEVWKDSLYNIYDYPCYDVYEDKIAEVNKIKQIVTLRPTAFWVFEQNNVYNSLFPVMREQVFYFVDGMIGYAGKNIFQPAIRFDAMHFAGAQQTV